MPDPAAEPAPGSYPPLSKGTNKIRKITFATTALAAVLAIGPAWAADEVNVAPGLTAAGAPLGLHGADPVVLLDKGRNVEGVATETVVHDGVSYYFANRTNRMTFEANPARYIVQNGGFCTFGVSVNKKFDGDPSFAAVVDDKLYVFLNEEIYQAFLKDKKNTIAKAADNWTRIKHIAATDL